MGSVQFGSLGQERRDCDKSAHCCLTASLTSCTVQNVSSYIVMIFLPNHITQRCLLRLHVCGTILVPLYVPPQMIFWSNVIVTTMTGGKCDWHKPGHCCLVTHKLHSLFIREYFNVTPQIVCTSHFIVTLVVASVTVIVVPSHHSHHKLRSIFNCKFLMCLFTCASHFIL